MKKLVTYLLAIGMVVTLLVGCQSGGGSTGETGEKKLRIGVTLLYKGDEWLASIANEFEKQCKDLGYEVNIQDGNQDNEKQMQQIENFIAQKYDVIVVSAANAEGILPAIDKAQEAGIPVISIDTPIDHEHVSACISWDNFYTGELLGKYVQEYIDENLKDNEKINVVLIDAPSYPHLVKRVEGFMSILEKNPKVNVIAQQDANGSRETSANIINNNIAKGIDIVYGVVDNHAWGAVTALEEANAENVAVFSCGGYGEEPFTALKDNHKYYKGIIVVPPTNIVKDTLIAVDKIAKGESVEKVINIEVGMADSKNVGDFDK